MTSNGQRLDAVEIKVTLAVDRVDAAIEALELPGDGDKRQIYFCEEPGLRLLTHGVILRLRHAGNHDDTTVKLRPCRYDQLTPRWLAMRKQGRQEFRLEADWSGERRVLAASLVAEHDSDRVDDVRSGNRRLDDLFTGDQRALLDECAGTVVDFAALAVLGPVRVRRWSDVERHGHNITAERWVVRSNAGSDLDFLELSVRAEPAVAEETAESFTTALGKLGIEPDPAQETKTRLVLAALAPVPG